MWKLDLKKAYDIINWQFLEIVLCEVGFPLTWKNLIMACVRMEQAQLSWNGEISEAFKFGRGIRQRDPLPLYLFVLCID